MGPHKESNFTLKIFFNLFQKLILDAIMVLLMCKCFDILLILRWYGTHPYFDSTSYRNTGKQRNQL